MTYHWWFKASDGWVPYTCHDSSELEHAHTFGVDYVELQCGMYSVTIPDRSQRTAGTQQSVVRGLWYFEKSNGSLNPYPEDFANVLEACFFASDSCSRVAMDKHRSVRRSPTGSFEQVWTGTGRIRRVIREYLPFQDVELAFGSDASFGGKVSSSCTPSDFQVVGAHRRAINTIASVLGQGYTQDRTLQNPSDALSTLSHVAV
jgi:hypothetical protein